MLVPSGCSGTALYQGLPGSKPSEPSCSILQGSIQQCYLCPTVILSMKNPPCGDARTSTDIDTEPRHSWG